VRYADNGEPIEIDTVVFSTVHLPGVPMDTWRDDILVNGLARFEHLITPNTKVFINPAGPWTVGGPIADSGLTGRKIIVDTYGGAARHGGGAFSGKDPTKVDRSAAYAARHLAKLLCHHLGRHRTEVQLSYAIGVAEPVSVHVYGMHEEEIQETLKVFDIDLTPGRHHQPVRSPSPDLSRHRSQRPFRSQHVPVGAGRVKLEIWIWPLRRWLDWRVENTVCDWVLMLGPVHLVIHKRFLT